MHPCVIIAWGHTHHKFLIISMELGASGQGYPSSRNKNLGSFIWGPMKTVSVYIGWGVKKSQKKFLGFLALGSFIVYVYISLLLVWL